MIVVVFLFEATDVVLCNAFSFCSEVVRLDFQLFQFVMQACHNSLYYINANEIPAGELSRENLISSHVKITCYLHM